METLLVGILNALSLDLDVIFEFSVAGLEERETGQTLLVLSTEDALVVLRADGAGMVAVEAIISGDALDALVFVATESIGAVSIGVATFGANSKGGLIIRGTPRGGREESAVVSLGATNTTSGGVTRVGADGGLGGVALVVGVANRDGARSSRVVNSTDGDGGQVADGTRIPGAVGIGNAGLAGHGLSGDGTSDTSRVGGAVGSATREERRAVGVLNAKAVADSGGGVSGERTWVLAPTRSTDGSVDGSSGGSSDDGHGTSKIASLNLGVAVKAIGVGVATTDGSSFVGSKAEITVDDLASLSELGVAVVVKAAHSVGERIVTRERDGVARTSGLASSKLARAESRESCADPPLINRISISGSGGVTVSVVTAGLADGGTLEVIERGTTRSVPATIVVSETHSVGYGRRASTNSQGGTSGYTNINGRNLVTGFSTATLSVTGRTSGGSTSGGGTGLTNKVTNNISMAD